MPVYQNPHAYIVSLVGPDGNIIKMSSRQILDLPEYFERYRSRGFIRLIDGATAPPPPKPMSVNNTKQARNAAQPVKQIMREIRPKISSVIRSGGISSGSASKLVEKKIVGVEINTNAHQILKEYTEAYPISNNIGIGILSYNRKEVLHRLIESIRRFTDLNQTTIFISDDGSDDQEILLYLDQLEETGEFIIIRNNERLGVAGNSNRLLRSLKRFKYGFLLNDDIEILQAGWEGFYIKAMEATGFHHFVYRKPGVYGAKLGDRCDVNDVKLYKVNDKPHGACLVFTNECLERVGGFNTNYGVYGYEHVDWSLRAAECNMQPKGFYDVVNSGEYITLHNDDTTVPHKNRYLEAARKIFKDRVEGYYPFDDKSTIPAMTYIVPFREQDRVDALQTVINNIRAQRFPEIEIILCEQDIVTKLKVESYSPVKYGRINQSYEHDFNKSMAFNYAVSMAQHEFLILHDADMLAIGKYTKMMVDKLSNHEACHMGATVLYADSNSTASINDKHVVIDAVYERVVGYYEGGSFGIRNKAYWRIGGYNEDFYGYGNEDTEFYSRMSSLESFLSHRICNFIHLYHGRSRGWTDKHNNNKKLEKQLFSMPMEKRISNLREVLKTKGYIS